MAGDSGKSAMVQRVDHGAEIATPARLAEAPGYVARRLYQSYVALWARVVDPTLTGPQFSVLVAVNEHPGVDQGSLASSVALDRSTMADVVRRMENNGLIVRHTALHDARRKLLYLTEEGERRLSEVNGRARALDEQLLGGYGPAERERLLRDLTVLANHWDGLIED
ncbi:hypothetical protein GCM10010191_13140 [Actinomadura vinacea]|uniref:HTH marR-type domain-containing protein n=1 Tax=Actinomadura vinacea TaxID=115336 RepID=A0ABN3IJ97_9ACTN